MFNDVSEPLSCLYLTLRLFYCLDDFARLYEDCERHHLIEPTGKRRRGGKLCLGEMLFIMVLFHLSPFKDFKNFYLYGVCCKYRCYFKELPSYGRFVSLMPRLFLPFCVLLHCLKGEQSGIYFVDSTKLAVCHNARITRHKVFEGMAKRGKSTMGWFYGFKLHTVINHKGEIMAVRITSGNRDDRSSVLAMVKNLQGKLFGDKGYISEKLCQQLRQKGIQLISGIRKNMKNHLMPLFDKLLLGIRDLLSKQSSIYSNHKCVLSIQDIAHQLMLSFILSHAWLHTAWVKISLKSKSLIHNWS